jgi:DNA-binding transcriptional LysR family regulator
MGIAEVPSILCQRELALGRLALVMPDWEFAPVDLSAYYLSRRHVPRIVELFLDHCSANAENALRAENASPLLPIKGQVT